MSLKFLLVFAFLVIGYCSNSTNGSSNSTSGSGSSGGVKETNDSASCTNTTGGEKLILTAVTILTGGVSFIACVASLLIIKMMLSTRKELMSMLYIVLSVSDIATGIVAACFCYTLSLIDTSTCTLAESDVILKVNQSDIKPLFVVYSQLFLVTMKLSAYSVTLLGIITSIAISKPGDKLNPRTVLYCIIMLFAALILFEARAASFNYDSYKLFHSLLYLPYMSNDYLAEKFSENSILLQIFVPIFPAVLASILGFVIVMRKRNMKLDDAVSELVNMVREKALSTVALILAFIFIIRSVGMPVFFAITQAGLLKKDRLTRSILINYLSIVFPILLTAAINPVVMIIFTKEKHLAELEDIASDLDDIADDMKDNFKSVLNKFNDINLSIPDITDEKVEGKKKCGLSCFRGKEKEKDTSVVDALVKGAESKANERRNEVYNTLEKRRREQQQLIKKARKDMDIVHHAGKERVKKDEADSPIFGVVDSKRRKSKFPDEDKDLNTLKKNIMDMDERESQKQAGLKSGGKEKKERKRSAEENTKGKIKSSRADKMIEPEHDYDIVKDDKPRKKRDREPSGDKEKTPRDDKETTRKKSKEDKGDKERPTDLAIKVDNTPKKTRKVKDDGRP